MTDKDKLATRLANTIDLHHRTLTPSMLHDPRNNKVWECECLTCLRTKELLHELGYNLEQMLTEYSE